MSFYWRGQPIGGQLGIRSFFASSAEVKTNAECSQVQIITGKFVDGSFRDRLKPC